MSEYKLIDGKYVFVIEPEEDGVCDICGKVAELRPYGPNYENICYECGMKDPETTKRMFNERLSSGPKQ